MRGHPASTGAGRPSGTELNGRVALGVPCCQAGPNMNRQQPVGTSIREQETWLKKVITLNQLGPFGYILNKNHEVQTYFCSLVMPPTVVGLCKIFGQQQLMSCNGHKHQGLDAKPMIMLLCYYVMFLASISISLVWYPL